MIRISVIISLMIVNCFNVFGQSAKDKAGFVKIFNGKTLAAWEGDPTYWRVEKGSLVGEITPST